MESLTYEDYYAVDEDPAGQRLGKLLYEKVLETNRGQASTITRMLLELGNEAVVVLIATRRPCKKKLPNSSKVYKSSITKQ